MTDASHKRSIVVWDVPTAVPCGGAFAVKAGIKCATGCGPDEWTLEIHDHEGNRIATRTVGSQPWPGTAALFPVEFELEAPSDAGRFAWDVIAPAVKREPSDAGDGVLQHETARARFNLRTVPAGECQLTVLAIDRQSQLPVPGLRVVVHPYRATTDVDGVARLLLPKGRYTVFVSGRNFFPLRLEGELTADLAIDAELEVDREPTDAELWS